MITLAYGNLKIGYTKQQGLYAYDGINFFKVFSPYLRMKYHKHKNKIHIFLSGTYITIGEWVVYFKRDKNFIARYIDHGGVLSYER